MAKIAALDAELPSWKSISKKATWSSILIGNGASQAIWEGFGYRSLFARARGNNITHPLSKEDKQLFTLMQNTTNFELVLGSLAVAREINALLEIEAEPIQERYNSIRRALIESVHSAHIPHSTVADEVLFSIGDALFEYSNVYSTNYDLLVYWALMHMKEAQGLKHKDFFWGDGQEFDITKTDKWSTTTSTYYLHGALHIYRTPNGTTLKDSAKPGSNLLDQFGRERNEIPLIISEGSSTDKLRSIVRSDYLSFCLQTLTTDNAPLVVFGHSLGDNDAHLVKAIQANTSQLERRAIAVSILPQANDTAVIVAKAHYADLFKSFDDVYFFDSTSHPLGRPDLRIEGEK